MKLDRFAKVMAVLLFIVLSVTASSTVRDGDRTEDPAYKIYGYYGNPSLDEFRDLRQEGTPLAMCYWLWNSYRSSMNNMGFSSFSSLKEKVLSGKDVSFAKQLAIQFKYGVNTQWYGLPVGERKFKPYSDWWEPWITASVTTYIDSTEAIVWKYLSASYGGEYAAETLKEIRENFGAYAHLVDLKQLDPEIFDKVIEYDAVSGGKGKIYPTYFEAVEPDWLAFVENGESHLTTSYGSDFHASIDSYYKDDSTKITGSLESKKIDIGRIKGGRHFYLIFPAEFMKYLYRETYPIVGTPDGLRGIPINPKKPRTLWMWTAAFSFINCYFWGGEGWSYWIPLGSLEYHEKYSYYYTEAKNKYTADSLVSLRQVHSGATVDECLRQIAEQNVAIDMFWELLTEWESWKKDKSDIPPDLPYYWVAFPYSKIAQQYKIIDHDYRPPSPFDVTWEIIIKKENPNTVTAKEFVQRFGRKLFDWFMAKSSRICRLSQFYKDCWFDWFLNLKIFSPEDLQKFKDTHDPNQWNSVGSVQPSYNSIIVTTSVTTSYRTQVSVSVSTVSVPIPYPITVSDVRTSMITTTIFNTIESFDIGSILIPLLLVGAAFYAIFWLRKKYEEYEDPNFRPRNCQSCPAAMYLRAKDFVRTVEDQEKVPSG